MTVEMVYLAGLAAGIALGIPIGLLLYVATPPLMRLALAVRRGWR